MGALVWLVAEGVYAVIKGLAWRNRDLNTWHGLVWTAIPAVLMVVIGILSSTPDPLHLDEETWYTHTETKFTARTADGSLLSGPYTFTMSDREGSRNYESLFPQFSYIPRVDGTHHVTASAPGLWGPVRVLDATFLVHYRPGFDSNTVVAPAVTLSGNPTWGGCSCNVTGQKATMDGSDVQGPIELSDAGMYRLRLEAVADGTPVNHTVVLVVQREVSITFSKSTARAGDGLGARISTPIPEPNLTFHWRIDDGEVRGWETEIGSLNMYDIKAGKMTVSVTVRSDGYPIGVGTAKFSVGQIPKATGELIIATVTNDSPHRIQVRVSTITDGTITSTDGAAVTTLAPHSKDKYLDGGTLPCSPPDTDVVVQIYNMGDELLEERRFISVPCDSGRLGHLYVDAYLGIAFDQP